MKIVWTPEAQRDRADVWDYIAADNPHAAVRMDKLFSNSVARLATHPMLGREGKISCTRELIIHKNYRLIYEVNDKNIWILALIHVARQWPPIHD